MTTRSKRATPYNADVADEALREGGLPRTYRDRLAKWVDSEGFDPSDPGGVADHSIPLRPGAWTSDSRSARWLRAYDAAGCITRGDVIGVFSDPQASPRQRLAVTYAWGYGSVGYGPRRLAAVLDQDIEGHLHGAEKALAAPGTAPHGGAVSAYLALKGKVRGLGPSFFTKYLYFADAADGRHEALIFDAVLARAMAELTWHHLKHRGVADAYRCAGWLWIGRETWGSPAPRSAYRYGQYLDFMHEQSASMGWSAAALERAMFANPVRPKGDS